MITSTFSVFIYEYRKLHGFKGPQAVFVENPALHPFSKANSDAFALADAFLPGSECCKAVCAGRLTHVHSRWLLCMTERCKLFLCTTVRLCRRCTTEDSLTLLNRR